MMPIAMYAASSKVVRNLGLMMAMYTLEVSGSSAPSLVEDQGAGCSREAAWRPYSNPSENSTATPASTHHNTPDS